MNLALLILTLGFAALGYFLHLRIQTHGRRAHAWPTTSGRVVSSQVRKVEMGGGAALTPAVVYSYDVGGKTYRSGAVRVGHPPFYNTSRKAEAAAARYPAGADVTVHYDPAAPTIAALDLEVGEGYLPLMAYTFGAMSLVLLLLRLAGVLPS